MKTLRVLPWLVLLSFSVLRAQEEPKDKVPEKKTAPTATAEKDPVLSVTEHQVTIGGKVVKYTATTGYLVLKTEKGEPRANIFFVAYAKAGESDPAKRPITFSFNGGPGSSSVWLHMGALGPKRVVMTDKGDSLPPPYKWVDNEYSWLDETDLVFIDPVSTGYSRAAKEVDPKQFHGFTGDIESVGEFIRLWTTRNARWASPKFLVGESYGTTRAAGLSDYLQGKYNFYLNGIMLVSSILNFQTARFAAGNDLPYQLFLPTYTASAFYHGKLKGDLAKSLPDTLARAEKFVMNDYALALLKGDSLPEAERQRIANEVAALTGLSVDYVLKQNLRINIHRFVRELKRDENRSIGRIDSRIVGIMDETSDGPGAAFDPSLEAIYGGYSAAMNDYARRQLKFESDLPYEILTGRVQPWSYSNVENEYLNVAETLKRAMTKNQSLKVWVSNGYYDLATPYFATHYTFTHMGLDPAVRGNVSMTYYEAGHMMYSHLESLKKFKTDFSAFMTTTLKDAGVK
ncbi:S10 family peptidase [Oleiharenicola lentus]|uniref:S10 family peptidase n=1 Tax=Oleiharenicola lentus TaxID=2508720 RepID=UPI003F669684